MGIASIRLLLVRSGNNNVGGLRGVDGDGVVDNGTCGGGSGDAGELWAKPAEGATSWAKPASPQLLPTISKYIGKKTSSQ